MKSVFHFSAALILLSTVAAKFEGASQINVTTVGGLYPVKLALSFALTVYEPPVFTLMVLVVAPVDHNKVTGLPFIVVGVESLL